MLFWAFVILGIGICSGFIAFTREKSTLTTITKIIFYLSLLLFIILIFAHIFYSTPPIPKEQGVLPL